MLYATTGIILFLLFAVANAQDHDVRLSTIGARRGRVEVMNNGQWGTVCQDGWGFYDALVVCKQLGFPWVDAWNHQDEPGDGAGPVWLSNVQCKGSETRLDECAHDGWTEPQCSDVTHAATVSCMSQEEFKDLRFDSKYDTYLSDGDGLANDEGTVTLELNTGEYNRRFLLCDQDWDLADASVICRQHGRHSAYRATTNSYFGRPRSRTNRYVSYLATGFACIGNESHILDCPAQAWFQDDCPSGNVAGVICNSIEEPEGFQLRLVNGSSLKEGRVEIYSNGSWGSICISQRDTSFSYMETNVICRQLGLGFGLEAPTDDRFGRSSGPAAMTGDISCAGGESSFAQCYHRDMIPNQECLSMEGSHEVNVICSGPLEESRSPVRLSSTKYKESGRVLIHHDGRWGTVCKKNWTMANSEVVCRELGFRPPKVALGGTFPGDGPISLGRVSCKGDEPTLDQCELGEWYQHDCDHTMDADILCTVDGASTVVSSAMLLLASFMTLSSFVE